VLPVDPVPVLDRHRDRAADGFTRANTGQDVGAVGFDRHAPTATVSTLSPLEIRRDEVNVDRQAGGNSFEDDNQRAAVRFARGEKTHH
jgi:hypothetical protein